jgi:hypothetical protein
MRVGSSSHILFRQAVGATVPRGPDAEAPWRGDNMPGSLLGHDGRVVGRIGEIDDVAYS